jgi:hypothetical protein
MSERTFCVYKHTCPLCTSTNGIYVGITCRDPEERWKTDGKGYLKQRTDKNGEKVYNQPKIAYAILKHTWDAFDHEILEENLTYEAAKQREIDYIDFFDSYEHGLNSTRGGDGFLIYLTEEEKRAATQQSLKKSYQKIKADPERYAKVLATNASSMKKFLANPDNYAAELDRCRLNKQKERQTDEGRERARARGRKWRQKEHDIRCKLREYFQDYPELFSAEDKRLAFSFKENDRKHYVCVSVKKLTAILQKVEMEINND